MSELTTRLCAEHLNQAGEWELRHGHTLGRPETITGILASIREA